MTARWQWRDRSSWAVRKGFVHEWFHLRIGASGCPLSDMHFQNVNLSLSLPAVLTIPPSGDASNWAPGTCCSTVLMQEATACSSSRRWLSEGVGSKGTVLNDFLSSGEILGDSTFASALVPGRNIPASTSSVVVTINKMNTTQMGEAIIVSFIL